MQNNFVQSQTSFQVYSASAGSGKTFTLVKEYLKILLQSSEPFIYQNILAITFTNKAASEMKERVLNNLLDFSKGNRLNDMFRAITEETNIDTKTIEQKSKRLLHSILQNYSAFHIKTIDSFTSKLIKSFAFDLGLSIDFEVELDSQAILEKTVDVIISKIGIDKKLTSVLVEFAKQKTLEDKSWDISRELKEIAILLLKENDAYGVQKLEKKNISDFKSLEKKIKKNQRETEKKFLEIGEKGLKIISELNIEDKDFYYSQFPKFFQNLINKPSAIGFDKDKGIGKSIENQLFYTKGKPEEIKLKIDSIIDSLSNFYKEAGKLFQQYLLNKLILKNLIPLAILNSISKALEEIKVDNNIRLIGEFNQIISKHLREQPAAFIYEKIGVKYKHYFIDEMQDTSILQWENLIPLIDNALSEENSSLLLVGDAKQAIYRWRGGKAEQFIDLSIEGNLKRNNPFHRKKKLENLKTNFRSYSEIIDFNNQFFTHISNYFQNEAYQNLYQVGNNQEFTNKKGGFVQLNFINECKNAEERDEVFPEKVYETIQSLEGVFDKNEICILVRKKKQGIAIANHLTEKGIQIISSETLLIKNNSKVDFIIQLLNLLKEEKDGNARLNVLYYLHSHFDIQKDKNEFIDEFVHLDMSNLFKKLEKHQIFYKAQNFYQSPFYESIEEIIRCFKLAQESDAYLQFFLDFVFEFTQRKSENNTNFLEYWSQKKEKLSIVTSNNKNAVQIMTIHKSKGLEFPVVIYPYDLDIYYQKNPTCWYDNLDYETYNNFESILINSSSVIKNTGIYGETIFKKQESELELDNFNLLYVALTRAKEHLYIISENKIAKDKLKLYSHFFIDFLQKNQKWEDGKSLYEFGEKLRLSKREKDNLTIEIQKEFISTSWQDHQFNIVASSSLLWDSEREDAIKFGNLIHELMAYIFSEKDIKTSVIHFVNKGLIEKKEQNEIENLISEIVNHKELKPYFQLNKTIFNEREIITHDKQILIPDRLVFDDENNVTIIDYKTGNPEEKHHQQIENYANTLLKMNFQVLEKILVYIDTKINIVKV
ncbi:MAG: UvrD-helicase domain-containing protein [Flavobacteriaceae bacterium]|nr:UvrD-helicase domain-containing protein [Flavobacteriaceae bacterium]